MKKLLLIYLMLFPCLLKAQTKGTPTDTLNGNVYPAIADTQVDRWNTPLIRVGLSVKDVMDDPFTVTSSGLPGVDGPITKWGDFDNDGDMDLYLCGFYSGGISDIFRNNGNGTFTALAMAFEIVSGSADWGDYDCDGDLDLLISGNCTSAGSHITRLYRNDGAGVFTNYAMDVPGGYLAKWGDYDSDGDPDILINEGDEYNNIEIYENKGTGTYHRTAIYFEKAETDFISLYSTSFDWGDYNNDGFPDVVISGKDDIYNVYCKIYRNNGNKTFTDLDLVLRGASVGRVNWGDFDNDNDLDILMTGNADIQLYRNEGNDIFSYFDADLAKNQEINSWIDVNNDGNLDIILSGLSNSGIYTGNGNGSFEYLPCPLANVQHADIDIADYDNDNDLDFVYAGYSSGNYTQIYKNNTTVVNHTPSIPTGLTARQNGADVVFSWNPASDYENGENLSYNITAGTSSGDCIIVSPLSNLTNGKRLKLNRGNAGNDTTWVLKNAPLGILHWSVQSIDRTLKSSAFAAFKSFEVKTPLSGIYIADASYNVSVSGSSFIDMNNDNLLDILVSGSHPLNPTKEVDCFINQGNNTFTPGIISGSKLVGKFLPCNLNNDTYMDALLYGTEIMYSGPMKIYGLINNKSGGFIVSTVDFTGISATAITTGDFDNDGDDDIVFIGYKNDISGTYIFEKESTGYAFHDLGIKFDFTDLPVSDCDVDNDLDLDIVYGPYILINDAEFIKKDVFPYKDVRSMDWGDFDGDGDLDVALCGRDTIGNLVNKIYENHGNLNFSPLKITIRVFAGDVELRWLDYNNDGLLDLAVSGIRDGTHIFIYLNLGNSFFKETDYPDHLVLDWGDFDDDGDMDINYGPHVYISNGNWINNPPQAPSGLTYKLDGFDVLLSWDKAEDEENSNGLTYNVKVGSNEGSYDVMQVLTAEDGQLRIPRMGNVQTNTSWRLKNLPLGDYYWSVQAVDQGFKGGEWAPEQKFTISNVSASFTADTVCEGFPTKFTDFSVASEGIVNAWKWHFGDGDSSMLQNPSHEYAHGGFYNVTLTAYAADYKHSIAGTIFVRYKPHAGFDASTVCEGNKTTFVNHSNIESITVDNWIWNFGDGDVSDVRGDIQHPYLAPGTYEAQLLITATNGCKDSLTREVVVGKIPTDKIGLDYGSKNMCTGDSSRLMVESSADYSYQWRKDGINMAKDTLNALLIKNKGDFSVEITNRLGNCSVISDTIGFTLLEAPPVMLVTSGADTEICQGDSVYFEVPYNAEYTYDWKYNGNSLNATSNLIVAGREGSYAAEVSNGTCSTMSQSRQVVYKPGLPEPTLMAFGPNRWYFVCNTENAQIYRWYYNGNLVAENKHNLYYAGTSLGEYYVEVNDGGECFVPSDKVVIPVIPTGIDDLPAENKLFLYPNPAKGNIRVLYSGLYHGDVLIRIVSAGGGIAKEYLVQKDHAELSEELDLTGFEPGMYIMEIHTNDNTIRSIFIIMK